jgi:hypothetical protein
LEVFVKSACKEISTIVKDVLNNFTTEVFLQKPTKFDRLTQKGYK